MPDANTFLRADYWTLRKHSTWLFETNIYARGLIRRLVTNEINTGLHLEATPIEKQLGFAEQALAEWSENVETMFELWASDPWLCDHVEQRVFGEIQAIARMQALVDGDVLVVMRQNPVTKLPRIQLISGASVQTPAKDVARAGNKIKQGVELDGQGRQVAYWILQDDGTSKRLPAYGEKSGRKLAWLLYGSAERRYDGIRGEPLLSLIVQSLKEIDRYRDATQRKAVINSMLAMFVAKTADKPPSQALTAGGGITRRGTESTVDSTGRVRRFNVAEGIPGLVIDELQVGETPHAFPQSAATEGFGDFEEAVIQTIAWVYEIPPEILRLSFSSNYSASKAANNEFEMYLMKVRTFSGNNFCRPIYVEWLVAAVLIQIITNAPGLLESWRDAKRFLEFGSWSNSDWAGQIKPSIDLSKMALAYKTLIEMGLITRDRAAREMTGMKFSRVIRQLERENTALEKANAPLVRMENGPEPDSTVRDDGTIPEDDQEPSDKKTDGGKAA
jgi:lambda family phage portal protein